MGIPEIHVTLVSTSLLLVTTNVVPSSPNLVTLMKEALSSSETSVLTRSTRRNIPEDAILYSQRRENFKSYIRWLLMPTIIVFAIICRYYEFKFLIIQ
jgi:hypothetical protein